MMQRKMNEHCERTAPAFDALKHTQTTLESKISELDAERSQRRTVVTDISRLQDQLQVLRGTIITLQDTSVYLLCGLNLLVIKISRSRFLGGRVPIFRISKSKFLLFQEW